MPDNTVSTDTDAAKKPQTGLEMALASTKKVCAELGIDTANTENTNNQKLAVDIFLTLLTGEPVVHP